MERQRVKVVNSVDEQEDWGENKVSDLIRKWGDGWRLTPGLVAVNVSHPQSPWVDRGPCIGYLILLINNLYLLSFKGLKSFSYTHHKKVTVSKEE